MTNSEKYEILIEKEFKPQDINQIFKICELGYDIYNPDIWMPSDKLRKFKEFLLENLKPEFTHDQLREIQIGFLNDVNVIEYADKKYSPQEMKILRKMLTNNKDISVLKKYSNNLIEMKIYFNAIQIGLKEEDFEKYSANDIKFISTKLKNEKEDVRELFDIGYDQSQIDTILKTKYAKDILKYITPKYNSSQIIYLAQIVKHNYFETKKPKYPDEIIKKIFNPKFNTSHLSYIDNSIIKNKLVDDIIDPKYSVAQMSALELMVLKKCKKEDIETIKKTDFHYYRYHIIEDFLKNDKFNKILLDTSIKDEFLFILNANDNLKLFKELYDKGFKKEIIKDVLLCDRLNINLVDYIDKDITSGTLNVKKDVFKYCKNNNLSNDEKEYAMLNINTDKELTVFHCCRIYKLDYKKINKNFKKYEIKAISEIQNKGIDLLSYINEDYSIHKVKAIGKALEQDLPLKNILKNEIDINFQVILPLEKFNKTHERQIDITEILSLNLPINKLGPLTSKLMSDNLEDNIQGYKQLEKIKQNDIETDTLSYNKEI